jgi:flagellum-specific ATP synthase
MRLDRTSFGKRLAGYNDAVRLPDQPILEGRLRMVGLTLEAEGLRAAVGSRCLVINDDSYHPVQVEAEVMGFPAARCS